MFEKILVCLDGSRLAEQILPYATEHARRCGSKLIFLRAYSVSAGWTIAAGAQGIPAADGRLIEQELESQRREADKYLERQSLPLREEGLEVSCVTIEGAAGDVIVAYAQNEPVDLIAIATHGHGGLGRVVFGSVADHVLKEAKLPLLIIRPEE